MDERVLEISDGTISHPVILKEPWRLKDLPMSAIVAGRWRSLEDPLLRSSVQDDMREADRSHHNENAKTSEFSALCEFYDPCESYSLADSSVAGQRYASVPAPSE